MARKLSNSSLVRGVTGKKLTKAQAALLDGSLPFEILEHYQRLLKAHLRTCRKCRRAAKRIEMAFQIDVLAELGVA